MTDRFVTVPDSLELPTAVKVPSARISDSTESGRALLTGADAAAQRESLGLGTAATHAHGDYATAAQGATADSAVAPKVYYVETWTSFFGGVAGAYPDARWLNVAHLTPEGLALWAAHILTNSPIPTTGAVKVTWFGDSWMQQQPYVLTNATVAHNPDATTVVTGIGGNTSAHLIARFAADVPADSGYVIFDEPGVNDVYTALSAQGIAANLATLVGLVRGIGAVPVVCGQVPLSEMPAASKYADTVMRAACAAPVQYPAADLGGVLAVVIREQAARSLAFGTGSQAVLDATSQNNSAFGVAAQQATTTGSYNTAVGAQAQKVMTTGANNNAVGSSAQYSLTTGAKNTAMGSGAQYSLTSASDNNALGYNAQNQLTTGINNTAIGSTAQYQMTTGFSNNAIGYAAQNKCTTGSNNTAIGAGAQLNMTTPTDNTAVGASAQYSLTTGGSNTAIGKDAQHSPRGVTANATTTAAGQTSVGVRSGQGSATQVNQITTVGFYSTAAAEKATALGASSSADHVGSVALGSGVSTTAAGQVAVGPRDVEVQDATKGLVLRSPDGTRYRVTVANGGTLVVTAL